MDSPRVLGTVRIAARLNNSEKMNILLTKRNCHALTLLTVAGLLPSVGVRWVSLDGPPASASQVAEDACANAVFEPHFGAITERGLVVQIHH